MYVQFTRWSGWNRLFSSWDVLIFNAPFFLFPTDGQCHEAWSSMCPIHFSPGFSSRHIVIRCLVSVLIAVGTHITWFWHVHATEVPHIVIATNLTTHILQYARFDLTGSLFALLCSDWPTSWCGMVWDGWNSMTLPNLTPQPHGFGLFSPTVPDTSIGLKCTHVWISPNLCINIETRCVNS